MPSERRRSTANRDRGAVAVETAFISMLLITLLFGIVESSFLFRDWLGVSAAARAGARMGASQPRSVSFAQDSANQVTNALASMTAANIQEVWVYKATGTTNKPINHTDFGSCDVSYCMKYTWNVGTDSLAYSSGNWLSTAQNACAGELRDSLGVYVKYRHTSPLGFFFNNATVSESTVMWLEPWFATATCKP